MSDRKKITIRTLFDKAAKSEPISWLTSYDYPTAYFQEQAGLDMILVGDSLGMTMLGYDSTLPVTMDDMIRHTQAVRRGAPTAFVIGDMPYMSYQPSVETAIRNAGRFMSETGRPATTLVLVIPERVFYQIQVAIGSRSIIKHGINKGLGRGLNGAAVENSLCQAGSQPAAGTQTPDGNPGRVDA